MPTRKCRAQNPDTCKYHGTPTAVAEAFPVVNAVTALPTHMVKTGTEIGALFTFANSVKGGYNPLKHRPPRNLAADSIMWTKPVGGLWISTVNTEGVSTWRELWGGDAEPGTVEKTVAFKPDAKVLLIDSLADYRAILDRYPHYTQFSAGETQFATSMGDLLSGGMSAVNQDGTAKRGMNFEALANDYDGIVLSQRGLYTCGRQDFRGHMNGDMSLYLWDIESGYVLNKNAITVQ